LTSQQVVAITGLPVSQWSWPSDAVVLSGGEGESLAFSSQAWEAMRARVVASLGDYHARMPDEPGLDAARLGRMTWPSLEASRWRIVVQALLS
ncbi:DNA/RNA-binding winged helix domain-containing protein, partial [Pandoraea pneumonica]|uniref:DNA/RNA-binding winged helix domain-containing protein n=1 Tax=Pandoraea pneumonica TaxID=2508299 RepID=UPI003CFAF61C